MKYTVLTWAFIGMVLVLVTGAAMFGAVALAPREYLVTPEQRIPDEIPPQPVPPEPPPPPPVSENEGTQPEEETEPLSNATTTAPAPPSPPAPLPLPKPSVPVSDAECDAERAKSGFFFDTGMQAFRVEQSLRAEGKTEDADALRAISCRPQAVWVNGGRPEDVRLRVEGFVKKIKNTTLVLVLYNSPDHTTAKWWSGIATPAEYREWITAVAEAIGSARVWVIVEPDALPLAYEYNSYDQELRVSELRDAVEILKEKAPNARVYLDGGHSKWKPVSQQAELLRRAGIVNADGFYTNVSNYKLLSEEIAYGRSLSELLNGKHFVIDTSRNGNGPDGNEWCNARGRALGVAPTRETAHALIDAYLWVKLPGESDGFCNGGPSPGKFWLEIALEMARNGAR